jgi:predicted O-methyltransferase YrrM
LPFNHKEWSVSIAIVSGISGADSGFFESAVELVRSIRDKPQGRGIPIYMLNDGLSESQRDWFLIQNVVVRELKWPYKCTLSPGARICLSKPHLPDYFPGHEIYVWIDADAWVQYWDAVELYCAGAMECGLCAAPELHPSYRALSRYWGIEYRNQWFGPARPGSREIPLNAGVFAGRANAPQWKAWSDRIASVVERPAFDAISHFALDGAALCAMVNRDRYDCAIVSERNNFMCNHGTPKVNGEGTLLHDPYPPYQPLGIVHDGGKEKRRLHVLRTIGGNRITRSFNYVSPSLIPSGDYVSPNFTMILLDGCLPNMVTGIPESCTWPHFRRGINHNWYVDRRDPQTGFINRDEAHILYNMALQFRDRQALEIGCHVGWSACHLAAAGVHLDVIDPRLADPHIKDSVVSSLQAAAPPNLIRLFAGTSPDAVEQLAHDAGKKWSFFFIDGDHVHPGPLNDAIVCERHAEADALILFHDLAAPDVAEGLAYLHKQGWKVRLYHTAQIMGAAWRGDVAPVSHQPDPTVKWTIPEHLRPFLGER